MSVESSGTRVRPGWVDDKLFPFESRFLDLGGNVGHYDDEGQGPVLLIRHGNPTWSFVYRQVIAELSGSFRCIALDYPGFGLSTAAPWFGFHPADHAQVVTEFVDHLDLNDTVESGELADPGVVRGHPLNDIETLSEPENIPLVLQEGHIIRRGDFAGAPVSAAAGRAGQNRH